MQPDADVCWTLKDGRVDGQNQGRKQPRKRPETKCSEHVGFPAVLERLKTNFSKPFEVTR